ncbi:Mitochondrial 2-oxoglutarate malate carrier [Musa troglodytarum]|uniref:Mitochondrial 2-oxoglutarate malate carrier n=1 Tax=Musa troglodytarum TaxID=320322 RepID=A0A9E7KCX0_9LILI|nr:Mitochondrial 2-oxoglutarate malate carrier [Musa troglodytarum]
MAEREAQEPVRSLEHHQALRQCWRLRHARDLRHPAHRYGQGEDPAGAGISYRGYEEHACQRRGLSAGLLRQATYRTARLGSFRVLTNKAVEANDGKPLPLLQKAAIGLTAGTSGACVGSPADLSLIRMQADATLPAAQ